MQKRCWLSFGRARVGGVLAMLLAAGVAGRAQIRDGGIDPANLGKGQWIYQMPQALAQMNGNVPAVTNLTSLMAFLKNQGMKYVIIKAASSDELFPPGNPQFTAELVAAAHAAGLWIFGYNRSYGLNIPGEIAISDYVFNLGADGFVFDAEGEWESHNLANNTAKAVQLCSAVRSNWPTKFLAHAPFPYISLHATFPYKEFGYYCDAVMPQAYWNSITMLNCSPTQMVTDMSAQWRTWQNSLSGVWTNSIKPICPVGNVLANSCNVNPTQITAFVNALKTDPNPATATGYKGVNYWVAEGQSAVIWEAIRTNNIGSVSGNAPVVTNVTATASANSATITWTTDQSSDSVVEYGLTGSYGNAATNSALLYYHTLIVPGLSNNTTYQFRAKSRNAVNQTGHSGNYQVTTLNASVADIYLDDAGATVAGTWTTVANSPAAYAGGYRYASTVAGGSSTVTFTPNIVTAGKYDVFVTFIMGANRTTNSNWTISYSGGSTNIRVNQVGTPGASSGWIRIASGLNFAVGTSGYVRLSNNSLPVQTAAIADGVKIVYVPPPPSPPSIILHPSNVTTNQGKTATFLVGASGTAPLSYQWKHAGTNLPGASTTIYSKANVQPSDGGNYSVTISNGVGFTNSGPVTLTVLPLTPPHIDSIVAQPDRRIRLQVSGGPGTFAVDQAHNLTSWTQALSTNVTGSSFLYVDGQTNLASRYYRARLLN